MKLARIKQIGVDVLMDTESLKRLLETSRPVFTMMSITGEQAQAFPGDIICKKTPNGEFYAIGIFTGVFSTGKARPNHRGNIILATESKKYKGIPVQIHPSQNPDECYVLPKHIIELYMDLLPSS